MNTNMDWLIRRKVSPDIIESFHIHTGDALGLENALIIPIYTPDGTFAFNKYRRDPADDRKPKYLYDKGGKVTLFGANHLTDDHKQVVVTEGELDALVLWSMNIPAVSSTGGAMSFQAEWAELLKDKEVFICFDNDDAGSEGAVKALSFIPTAKVIQIPEQVGVKDITDFVVRDGNFPALMASSKSYPDEQSVVEDMSYRSANWQSTRFHEKWLKKHREEKQRATTPRRTSTMKDDKILNAREHPIAALLKFNSQKNAICPFHNEKTPSLHYYAKTNSTYCFGGCGKRYDSIDIYMRLHSVDFRTAVEDLNRL